MALSKEIWLMVITGTLAAFIKVGDGLTCEDSDKDIVGACVQLSRGFEKALLQDDQNQFRIRRMFFHSPTASLVLLKVVYNIIFEENVTMAAAAEQIPPCFSQILNSTIELEHRNITLGWSSSGVYTMFHPTVLSVMQVQSPFAFFRIAHLILNQRSPEADSFLWDGSYDLPTLHLNMHITSLSCIPSQDLLESVLIDFNTLLKLYGGQKEILNVADNAEFIGFTLPNTSVTNQIIPIDSDVIIINIYSFVLCTLYAISICLLTIWYYLPSSKAKMKIDDLINSNRELSLGIRITSSTALVIEFISRLINCITWSISINNPSGVVLAVWMPQIHLIIMAAIQISFIGVYVHKRKGGYDMESQLRTFSNMCATSFMLFYLFTPTVILMFAYPTQIVVIFTFVSAYLFATSIFSASMVKLYNHLSSKTSYGVDDRPADQQINRKLSKKALRMTGILVLFFSLWVVILGLHFLAIFISYSLLIGKGSVINTGPFVVLSLLPSVLLSGFAWIAKEVTLKSTDERVSLTSQNEDHELLPIQDNEV